MPVLWYNPLRPQGSWFDDEEDQGVVQEDAVDRAPIVVDPVEPQAADKENDLAPVPNHEEYATIL